MAWTHTDADPQASVSISDASTPTTRLSPSTRRRALRVYAYVGQAVIRQGDEADEA
jgi:hypothetical protein